jgi:enoyl-CoA hydratase|tara:strand:- start:852 stop:1628 length:777 start_codon:yes stop_codon:yes gene_type:complete
LEFENIKFEHKNKIAIITLNRPESLNAMNSDLRLEIVQAMEEVENNQDICAVIFTGEGRAFSAGGDIKEQVKVAAMSDEERVVHREKIKKASNFSWLIANSKKPTIGAINGIAFGGAALLSSTFDIRVGSEKTSFRYLAATYGQANSTWSLPMVVGMAKAKELMFTGREVKAEEAFQIGLLNHLVAPDEVMPKSLEIAELIAAGHANMIQGIKTLLHEGTKIGYEDRLHLERDALGSWMKPVDPRDGFVDFLSTRKSK